MGDLLGTVGGDDMVLHAAPSAPGDGSGVARAPGPYVCPLLGKPGGVSTAALIAGDLAVNGAFVALQGSGNAFYLDALAKQRLDLVSFIWAEVCVHVLLTLTW